MRSSRVFAVLLAVLTGCSGSSPPASQTSYDSEKARTALVAALDAWKKGEAKSLAKREPPIRFVDDDLIAGLRLSDYEIDEPDLPVKPHQDVSVRLSLRDARGQRIQREARYQIGTGSTLSVLRSDH
jgi:hypothetical protein